MENSKNVMYSSDDEDDLIRYSDKDEGLGYTQTDINIADDGKLRLDEITNRMEAMVLSSQTNLISTQSTLEMSETNFTSRVETMKKKSLSLDDLNSECPLYREFFGQRTPPPISHEEYETITRPKNSLTSLLSSRLHRIPTRIPIITFQRNNYGVSRKIYIPKSRSHPSSPKYNRSSISSTLTYHKMTYYQIHKPIYGRRKRYRYVALEGSRKSHTPHTPPLTGVNSQSPQNPLLFSFPFNKFS